MTTEQKQALKDAQLVFHYASDPLTENATAAIIINDKELTMIDLLKAATSAIGIFTHKIAKLYDISGITMDKHSVLMDELFNTVNERLPGFAEKFHAIFADHIPNRTKSGL